MKFESDLKQKPLSVPPEDKKEPEPIKPALDVLTSASLSKEAVPVLEEE